jgi:hypothetical protein
MALPNNKLQKILSKWHKFKYQLTQIGTIKWYSSIN